MLTERRTYSSAANDLPAHEPALEMDGPLSLSLSPKGERVPEAGEGPVRGFKARIPSGDSLPWGEGRGEGEDRFRSNGYGCQACRGVKHEVGTGIWWHRSMILCLCSLKAALLCRGRNPALHGGNDKIHALRRLTAGAWLVIGISVLLTSGVASRAAQLEFPQLWQTDLQTFLESSGLVADLKGDGREEAVIAGREDLFALDGQGKVLWRWRTKGRFMTYPAVLVRPPQASLIYAADNSGLLTCLDGTGKEVWHAQLSGPSSWSASVVCDLQGNGDADVIQTDETGTVWAFAALTGKVLWQTKLKGIPVSPAVGDLDGDGKPEIVVATGQGIVTALNGNGSVLWERTIGGSSQSWATAAPVIFAASDGRGRVAAASSDGQLFCLDAQGGGALASANPRRGGVLDFRGRP